MSRLFSSACSVRHVLQRADERPDLGVDAAIGQPCAGGLGNAEIDHLGHRPAVVEGDQDVRRLEVAVDHALLVGVLHGLADRDEQRQPLAGRQPGPVAIVGDRHALDQLHHEIGAALGLPCIQDLGDVRMIHQGQRLPLLVEAGEHPLGVKAGANHLDGDAAVHGLDLVGDPDLAHAPFAELLAELEAAGEDAFGQKRGPVGRRGLGRAGVGAALEDSASLPVGLEQALDAPAKVVVAPASPVQKCAPLGPGGLAQRGGEDRLVTHRTRPPPSTAYEESIAPGGPSTPLYATSKQGRRHQPFIFLRNPARPWRCTARPGRTARRGRLSSARCPGTRPPARASARRRTASPPAWP